LGGTRLGFSDLAAGPRGELFYLAAAEAKASTVEDGVFRGAVLGRLTSSGKARPVARLKIADKPEGLCFCGDGRDFLVVTDADDPRRPSRLYRGRLP